MYTEPVKKSCITFIVFKYYGFLYRCEFFVRDPREWRWTKSMNMVSGQVCLLHRWIPVYSGLIDLTNLWFWADMGFSFSILKQKNTWKKVKVEIPPEQNNVCLPADRRIAWVFKSVLNINNIRSRIAYFTDEAQHLLKAVIFCLIFGVRIKNRHLFLRALFVIEVLMQATV